jgi:hypothetical protein
MPVSWGFAVGSTPDLYLTHKVLGATAGLPERNPIDPVDLGANGAHVAPVSPYVALNGIRLGRLVRDHHQALDLFVAPYARSELEVADAAFG